MTKTQYPIKEELWYPRKAAAYSRSWRRDEPCRCWSTRLVLAGLGLDAVLFLALCVGFAL